LGLIPRSPPGLAVLTYLSISYAELSFLLPFLDDQAFSLLLALFTSSVWFWFFGAAFQEELLLLLITACQMTTSLSPLAYFTSFLSASKMSTLDLPSSPPLSPVRSHSRYTAQHPSSGISPYSLSFPSAENSHPAASNNSTSHPDS